MIVTVFRNRLKPEHQDEYYDTANRMAEIARSMAGLHLAQVLRSRRWRARDDCRIRGRGMPEGVGHRVPPRRGESAGTRSVLLRVLDSDLHGNARASLGSERLNYATGGKRSLRPREHDQIFIKRRPLHQAAAGCAVRAKLSRRTGRHADCTWHQNVTKNRLESMLHDAPVLEVAIRHLIDAFQGPPCRAIRTTPPCSKPLSSTA